VNRCSSAMVAALVCLGFTQTVVAGLVPGSASDACSSAKSQGYDIGLSVGYSSGYNGGVNDGVWSGIQLCQQNPAAYGITMAQVIQSGAYGETEPNDNMIGANALVGGVAFTGQSYGPADRDWFYAVTSNPNQTLTIDFTVPGRDPATQDVSGWIIQVTDSAGNVYASFSTDLNQGNPNGDDEITYPVTLGLVGTYYVVVKPVVYQDASGLPSVSGDYYHLVVYLTDSDVNTLPVAVNFFDAEVEPNNAYTSANPLASGVTMYGLINLSFKDIVTVVDGDGTAQYAQGEDDDWYAYQTDGNEIVTLSFCNKKACQNGDWFVDVYDATNAALVGSGTATPLVAFNTDSEAGWPYTMNFGLGAAGTYYMRVNHKRKLEAPCLEQSTAQQCLNQDGICIVQSCTTAAGETCTPPGEEGDSCTCEDVNVDNCGLGNKDYKTTCWEQTEECVQYGATVLIPDTEVTSQYNFTWYGTKMQPLTADTPAYGAYQQQDSSTPTAGY